MRSEMLEKCLAVNTVYETQVIYKKYLLLIDSDHEKKGYWKKYSTFTNAVDRREKATIKGAFISEEERFTIEANYMTFRYVNIKCLSGVPASELV